MRRVASRAAWTAGRSSPAKTPMIAMTMSSSMSVNPLCLFIAKSSRIGGFPAASKRNLRCSTFEALFGDRRKAFFDLRNGVKLYCGSPRPIDRSQRCTERGNIEREVGDQHVVAVEH